MSNCKHKWETGLCKVKDDISYTDSVCTICGEKICILPTLNFLPILTQNEFDELVVFFKERNLICKNRILDHWNLD